uniref:Uncharacterized protein n=1 Tax=Romanomermis culicivorax TaxID=13658 RepID=A0A915J7D4_ROMCU
MCQKLWRPFNDDQDDLELNYLLDRNAQTAMFVSKRVPTPDFRASDDWPTGSFWTELPKTKFTEKQAVRKNRQPKMYAAIEMEGKYGVELWEKKTPGKAWQNLQVEYANDPDFAGPEIFGSTRRLSLHF